MVVRGSIIRKEIPLEHFSGRPISQFLSSNIAFLENNVPIYKIRIYDPVTDDTLELKGIDEFSVEVFERIGEIIECPYCGYDNSVLTKRCKNCGAVL